MLHVFSIKMSGVQFSAVDVFACVIILDFIEKLHISNENDACAIVLN